MGAKAESISEWGIDLTEGLGEQGDFGVQMASELLTGEVGMGEMAARIFRPTVLAGLGGTGVESVRRAKHRITSKVGKLPTLACVYIDADERSFTDGPGLAPVGQHERCFIGGQDLRPLVENPDGHAWLFQQIPGQVPADEIRKTAQAKGCGQVRAAGRVAVLASMLNLREIFGQAVRRVRTLAAEMSGRMRTGAGQPEIHPAIYMVCSLAGGTGSGSFLDVALLARELAGSLAEIVGIFVLPEAFDEKAQGDQNQLRIMRANTYAALTELQALQDGIAQAPLEVILNSAGEKVGLPRGVQLFDLCYLVDIKNENQKRLSRTEDVFEAISRLLVHEVATPVGQQAHSVQRNLNTLRNIARCPETGLPRNFSSFACTRLGFPVERLTHYCAWATLQEVLEDELLKAPLSSAKRAKEVQGFLSTNELDEQGPTDQVIEHLLRDDNGSPISETSEGIPRTFGQDKKPADFVRAVRQKMETFRQRSVPKAEEAIRRNVAFYVGEPTVAQRPLERKLDAALNEWLASYGSRGAGGILEELVSKATALRGEMLSENDAWSRENEKSQNDTLENALNELSKMSRLRTWVSSKDERLKGQAITAFQAIARETLRVPARNAAIRVYDELLNLTRSRKQMVDSFSSQCETVANKLRDRLNALRVEGRRETPYFIVDLDVTERGFLEQFFKTNRVPPAALLEESQKSAGAQGYFRNLLSSSREWLVREFTERAAARYSEKIKGLDVVSFIASEARAKNAVAVKLEELFAMCVPFWSTRLPQAGMQYDQHAALGCMPRSVGADQEQYPPEVQEWAKQFAAATTGVTAAAPTIVPTTVPYEIEMARYVHGARAWYLTDASDWKQKYEQTVSTNAFPVHTHACLGKLPDLFPDRTRAARQAFALGMAFGFIAKRGDYYYLNLQRTQKDNATVYEVPLETDWQTVFGPPENREVPEETGAVCFLFSKKRRLKEDLLLAQGRTAACGKLSADVKKTALIVSALDEYVKAVGSAKTKAQLSNYVTFLGEFPADKLADQIEQEGNLIEDYVRNLGLRA
jgi:hypothetical protein